MKLLNSSTTTRLPTSLLNLKIQGHIKRILCVIRDSAITRFHCIVKDFNFFYNFYFILFDKIEMFYDTVWEPLLIVIINIIETISNSLIKYVVWLSLKWYYDKEN